MNLSIVEIISNKLPGAKKAYASDLIIKITPTIQITKGELAWYIRT